MLGLSLAFSVLLYALVDRPVDKWRHWATKRLRLSILKRRPAGDQWQNLLTRDETSAPLPRIAKLPELLKPARLGKAGFAD